MIQTLKELVEAEERIVELEATIAELREWFVGEYGGQLPLRIMEILSLDQDAALLDKTWEVEDAT